MLSLDAFFKEKGLLLKEGNRVDASFIQANSQAKKDAEKQSNCDAEWGHKGFGYSATVNADRKTKLIRRVNTTSERPHDSKQLRPVLVGDEKERFGDSGENSSTSWGLPPASSLRKPEVKKEKLPQPYRYETSTVTSCSLNGEHRLSMCLPVGKPFLK